MCVEVRACSPMSISITSSLLLLTNSSTRVHIYWPGFASRRHHHRHKPKQKQHQQTLKLQGVGSRISRVSTKNDKAINTRIFRFHPPPPLPRCPCAHIVQQKSTNAARAPRGSNPRPQSPPGPTTQPVGICGPPETAVGASWGKKTPPDDLRLPPVAGISETPTISSLYEL
jgi:hypothetical protein